MNKTMQKFWINKYTLYLTSDIEHLRQIYDRYSENKLKALYRCERIMDEHSGRDGRIISHNVHAFTYAFIGDLIDEESGEVNDALYVITKDNVYAAKVDDIKESLMYF